MGADDLPKRARTPCRKPSCPALTDRGYCPTHQQEATKLDQARRGTAAQRGYDSKWARYSRKYRREHPICAMCPNPTAAVDHIIPVTGPDDPGMWDPQNHQPLCRSHHGEKTHAQGGSVNRLATHPPQTVFTQRINGTTGLPTPWFL